MTMVSETDLVKALRIIVVDESLGDFVYSIRERIHDDSEYDGSIWDHPRVKAFSDAVQVLEQYIREHDVQSVADQD